MSLLIASIELNEMGMKAWRDSEELTEIERVFV